MGILGDGERVFERNKLFMFCRKVVECLVLVKNEIVMFIIFNEVDMGLIFEIRN